MATLTVHLPDEMQQWLDQQVEAGGHSSVEECVLALLREELERKAESRLEALLLEGLNSGQSIEVTPEYWKDRQHNLTSRLSDRAES